MTQVYLDASCIIYLVEASSPLTAATQQQLEKYRTPSGLEIITSQISRVECRTRPLRDGDANVLADYDTFFSMKEVKIFDVTKEIANLAATLRAKYEFKTPDALHIATAIEHKATAMFTGDAKLKRCTEVRVELVSLPK